MIGGGAEGAARLGRVGQSEAAGNPGWAATEKVVCTSLTSCSYPEAPGRAEPLYFGAWAYTTRFEDT